jgi:outer membrane murein-binding lipoprotein Lpp
MKNFKAIASSILVISFLLAGCNSKPEDIKLNELNTVCDYVDALEKVVEADIKLMKEKKDTELSDEDIEYRGLLRKKLEEISEALMKKFSFAEMKECENFASFKEKFNESGGKDRW